MAFCMLPDVLHALLSLFGTEKLMEDERYSHSLLIVLSMAVVVLAIFLSVGSGAIDSIVYALMVLLHFFFDMLNRERMPITPWGGSIPGIGLHEGGSMRGVALSFTLEILLIFASCIVYAASGFDGTAKSLLIPAIILICMLAGELFYFPIYYPVIEKGFQRLMERVWR